MPAAIPFALRTTLALMLAYWVSFAIQLDTDRLTQAQVWLGEPTPARLAVLRRLYRFAELGAALQRAQNGLATVLDFVERHAPSGRE